MGKILFGPMNVVLGNTLIERKDLAMMIDAPPRFVQSVFGPARSGLTKPQFHHLWTLVLGILLTLRRAKLTHLAGALPGHTHRTAHGVFLSRSDWDAAGLGDYQVLSKDAIQRHLHLCGLAHLLLTHHSMDAVGAQARKANTQVPLPTMNERLDALRDRLRREQVHRLCRGKRHHKLRQRLKEYLLAA